MDTEIFYKNLGQKLKKYRKDNGYTQEQLGEKLGITKSAIVNYETGIRKIPFDVLATLCDLYKVRIDDLVTKQTTLNDILQNKIGQTPLSDQQEKLLINYIDLLIGENTDGKSEHTQ